jgi:D-alanine-D-alanine ligase
LQGLLELSGVPYTCSGVGASAAAMDKSVMKRLFERAGLKDLPYESFSYSEYKDNLFAVAERIKANLAFPLIVKPARAGSSIGIGVAHDFKQLFDAVDAAFLWDNNVIIENALEDFTELNCAVLGAAGTCAADGSNGAVASEIEKPVGWTEFLSYGDKYVKKSKGNGRVFPADIEPEMRERVQAAAVAAFNALGCGGVARADFLLKDGELYINEINSVPGALSNYLFPDLSFSALIDKLLEIALEEHKRRGRLWYVYEPAFNIGELRVKS